MNALSSKLASLGAALLVNGLVMAGVVYLFALQAHPHMSAVAFARAVATHQWLS